MVAVGGPTRGWYLARSLVTLFDNANTYAPRRSQRSDGSVGDTSHQARASDHNPDRTANGIVRALDLTHDPAGGFDTWKIAQHLAAEIAAGHERRVAYLISGDPTRRGDLIFHKMNGRWQWDPHPHTNGSHNSHHLHVSVAHDTQLENDTTPWSLAAIPATSPTSQEDEQMDLIQAPNGTIAITNWVTKRALGPKTLAAYKVAYKSRCGKDPVVNTVDQDVFDGIPVA